MNINKKYLTVSLISAFFIALAGFILNDVIMLTKYPAFVAMFIFTTLFAYIGMARGK